MRRIFAFLLLCACAVQPLFAGQEGAPGTNVEMPFLIAPMSKDGKLLGYSYISAKLVASSQSAAIDVRDKLAFIQDAFVRDVNAEPIGKPDDPTAVDAALLNQRLVADARRIVGDAKVVTMIFIEVQFAPLHPGDATLGAAVPPPERAPAAAAANQPAGQGAAPASPATPKPAETATH